MRNIKGSKVSKHSDDSKKDRWWPWLLLFLGVIILWGILWALSSWGYPKIEERGQFGDSFGGINALFAGLAFAGVICAILLQKKELELQRKELEETRAEIRGQKEQLQAQNQTLQKQNFESSFFQLLSMHGEIVNSMTIPNVLVNTSGFTLVPDDYCSRECFIPLFQKLREVYEVHAEQICASNNPEEARKFMYQWAKDKYEEFYRDLEPYVDHYFRHLYYVVNFVDQSDFSLEAKKFYTGLIRAQLSNEELGLLFYYGLSNRGADFRILIQNIALFEDIRFQANTEYINKVLMIGAHWSLYDPRAYGESVLNRWDG